MRPEAPLLDDIAACNRRRSVQSEDPLQNRQSAVQPRTAIPPPPRVPREAVELLGTALGAEGAHTFHADGEIGNSEALALLVEETLAAELPELPMPDVRDILIAGQETRITDLQRRGSELLGEARAARRREADARYEADVWRRRALETMAAIRRIDPIWQGGGSCS